MFIQLITLCQQRDFRALKSELEGMLPVDIAEFIGELENETALIVFRLLSKDTAADVFSELSSETHEFIISSFSDKELSRLINDLYVDDAVDMLEDLPAGVVKRVLKAASPDTRELINRFLKYEDGSVGSIMTAEFAELRSHMTVLEAVAYIKKIGIDLETIYTCYVTDSSRFLVGAISFKDMLFAQDDDLIGDIMETEVKFLHTNDDREEAASLMSKYGFLAMPAVDGENRLVGIVTVDDVLEVIESETSEDIQKMSAILPTETPYLETGAGSMFKSRIVWLILLMLSGILSGMILTSFEEAIAVMPILVAFMPMITGTGGNAGGQSSTTIIRALAVGEVTSKDFFRVMLKEVGTAAIDGLVLGIVNFGRIMLMYPPSPTLLGSAFVISLCLLLVVMMASFLGAMLPMAAYKLKLDPAIMAGPLIATLIDILGLITYFSVASAVLIH